MNEAGERVRRWRLILGDVCACPLSAEDRKRDAALAFVYEQDKQDRRGGYGDSAPSVSRWLGDIRAYFPESTALVLQQDALERRHLKSLLLDPELLASIKPDVRLVTELMALSAVIPEETKDTARQVVRSVVEELMRRLEEPLRSAVTGALDRSTRNRRPRYAEIDWNATIRANLRYWQEEYHTIIPRNLIGYGRKSRRVQREVVLCIDQSGSMAESIVYAGIYGAVMASLPSTATRVVLFDTEVADLTDICTDPVDILFGVQLGGGTDINRAVTYCRQCIREPRNTIFVLISDLYEGGDAGALLRQAAEMKASGMCVIVLLALSDNGAPSFDRNLGARLASLGIPSFACTPDKFPELMAAAIRREDIGLWAAGQDIAVVPPDA
ncbi:VWA domain-containing protein [uncultured Desulfovibrio sp.]|uniref:VWA domain-containing protein n=1 Tax=uncultured Desulfovibrio sp. TaxID=167968 RepID=UPI0026074C4F|nr:VWA domain-containing protein [uncultured Desulfovibrio sp.]